MSPEAIFTIAAALFGLAIGGLVLCVQLHVAKRVDRSRPTERQLERASYWRDLAAGFRESARSCRATGEPTLAATFEGAAAIAEKRGASDD